MIIIAATELNPSPSVAFLSAEALCEGGSVWTSHPETALKSPAVWQSWAAWNKKYARRSRSYGEHIFCENCPRLPNPARLGVRFLDVMSIGGYGLLLRHYGSPQRRGGGFLTSLL